MFNSLKKILSGDEKNKNSDNEYLNVLFGNLQMVKEKNAIIPFKIVQYSSKGFIVKIGGLFGFISYNHMPWSYKNPDYWIQVAPYLLNTSYYGQIYFLEKEDEKIKIIVDGKKHQFPFWDLMKGEEYNCLIIQKTEYGIFLDAAIDTNWEYGSFFGLAHRSSFIDPEEFENLQEGDLIKIKFWGNTKEGDCIFGEIIKNLPFFTGEIEEYIGKIVEVTVKTNTNKLNEYFLENELKGRLIISKLLYPDNKNEIKKLVSNFEDNQRIYCEVIKVKKNKQVLDLKFIPEK